MVTQNTDPGNLYFDAVPSDHVQRRIIGAHPNKPRALRLVARKAAHVSHKVIAGAASEFKKLVVADVAKWAAVIKAAGVKAE